MTETSGRTALLRATIVIVANGGLRALTYRAVAAEAGVSHGLVRHHFGTRDQLIADAMDFAISQSLLGTNMLNDALTIDEFAAGIETLSEREGELEAFQYELLLETRRRPELRHHAERYYEIYRSAIAQQLQRLGVDDPDLAGIVWFMLDGIVFKQLVVPGDVEPALHCIREVVKAAAQRS